MSSILTNIEVKSKENSFIEISESNLTEIINQCKQGVRKAQYSFYKKTFNFMYLIAVRYEKDHDEALFIINEAFFKVLTNIEKFDINKNIYSWIKVILINTIINRFKSNNNFKNTFNNISISEIELANTSVSPDVLSQIESEYVLDILNNLPEVTRKIFNLFIIEDYSHKEIADMLNISINASKWHVYEGKRKIKELLLKKK